MSTKSMHTKGLSTAHSPAPTGQRSQVTQIGADLPVTMVTVGGSGDRGLLLI